MAPAAQQFNNISPKDDIVISGISGRFPESDNMEEFQTNLFEGIDMVTEDDRRWPPGLYGLPLRNGKLKDLSKFDAGFFAVHPKQAEKLDPQVKMLLEATFEAIIDAGINPSELRGSNTGVFVGVSSSESGEYWSQDPEKIIGYSLTGCTQTMFPNRISYSFNFKGPSFAVDTACSSSMVAFHQACSALRNGECDAAVVGGVNLILKPTESLQFHKLGMLSPDGSCKAFDSLRNGYVRSEACAVVLLQKSKHAKRVYATVINTGINTDGHKEEGITFPSGAVQKELILRVMAGAGIKPSDVSYVEAHGTGTKVGDPQEVNTIAEVFCKEREKPLLIGSVKSNMGHAEPGSGLCSLAKVLIAMETGIIPSNLHFKNPNEDIPALFDGRIQVVNKNCNWNGGIAAINSFGFGGANAHVLLKSNPKPKSSALKGNAPILVGVSGRTYEAVDSFLTKIESNSGDGDFITMIHDIHKQNIVGHPFRGFTILEGQSKTREISEDVIQKQVWYVFSGMGTQWPGMGRMFMTLEPFSKAIHKCAAALTKEGVDLLHLIHYGESALMDNLVNCFVMIAAIQVALVDLLSTLGISPDGMIGHSVGELGCAYADGAFTAEQTVLAAYWRGRCIVESALQKGAMFAVGLNWDEVKDRLPPTCFAACNNGASSVTVSGPVNDMKKFGDELKNAGIFAKEVNSSGYAFHSKYIADAAPKLRSSLEKVIPVAKPRSSKWISSSIPESKWSTELARTSSVAYHVNNLLSPVLFREALLHIPDDAIVIEVAPHCLLQAILKREVPKSCTNIGLVRKEIPDEMSYLLASVGKLYLAGLNPNMNVFFRPSLYPVGRGTPNISSMVKWDHSIDWEVADFSGRDPQKSGNAIIEVNMSNEADNYLLGHKIDGRILFPATGYITLIWKTFAKINQKSYDKFPVVIDDIEFLRATILPSEGAVQFLINFFDGSGEFEICEGGTVVAKGRISKSGGIKEDGITLSPPTPDTKYLSLNKDNVYKDLKLRGYDYSGVFKGIISCDNTGVFGELEWMENWISFMDTMLQFQIVGEDTKELYLPTRIQRIVIDPIHHLPLVTPQKGIEVQRHKSIRIVKSGGIEIRGIKANLAPRRLQTNTDPILEQYSFVPYFTKKVMTVEDAVTIAMQLVLENTNAMKLKVLEIASDKLAEQLLAPIIVNVIESEPQKNVTWTIVSSNVESHKGLVEQLGAKILNAANNNKDMEKSHVIVGENFAKGNNLENIISNLNENGFLLSEEASDLNDNDLKKVGLVVLSKLSMENKSLYLLQKIQKWVAPKIVKVTQNNFNWLEEVKSALNDAETTSNKYLIVSEREPSSGIIGMYNCIKQEPGGEHFRCVFIDSPSSVDFTPSLYEEHLRKGLNVNILKGNEWGSFRHLKICKGESLLPVEHAYINALTRGDLSSLKWIESPLTFYRRQHHLKKELCTVYYAPLNFRDIMLASGKLPPDALPGNLVAQDCILGLEFVGRDSKGNRVMGSLEACGLATSVLADPIFLWTIPDRWTMEEAATIPVVYSTSYYALIVRGKLKRGESILIHAGSGGVGQASITIAISMGCNVFTTVGSQQKRDFLKKRFPELKDSQIGNSRDTSFEQMVLAETDGRGVDIVLNSLAEDKLQASVRCLATHGRFLEIGKLDLSNNSALGMSVLLKNTSVHGILLDALFAADCEMDDKVKVVELMRDGIASGVVRPLPSTTFYLHQIEQAFRFMASGKHIGKVLLKIRDEEKQKVVQNISTNLVPAIPKTYMNPDKSYIITGGLGGFGIELANWLLDRGARTIVLVSRSGVSNGYQSMYLRRWKEMGLNVLVSSTNPDTLDGANKLLIDTNKLAPVGGIFNLAAVLKDGFIQNQTVKDFELVCNAKINTTISLDKGSRLHCPQLDYFVVFSSISCGRGNGGQANYGFANSTMERICEARQSAGLPGMAIQWGAIGDVGIIIENMKGDNDTLIGGTVPQRINSCLATMDMLLQQMHPVVASMVLPEKRKSDEGNKLSLLESVKNILGVKNIKSINPASTLADLGLDSLMTSEIKQTLERNYDIVMSTTEIRSLTINRLHEIDAEKVPAHQQESGVGLQPSHDEKLNGLTDANDLVHFHDEYLMPKQTLLKLKDAVKSKTNLFIVHPIEGLASTLTELSSHLNCTVWGLQCTYSAPLGSLQELAASYLKEVRKVQPTGPYNLSGYSFGAAVAFEMALQLEAEQKTCNLLLLDGSPEYVLTQTEFYKQRAKRRNDTADESDAFAFFISLFAGLESYSQVKQELKTKSDLESRLKFCSDKLQTMTKYIAEDISQAALSFYKKLIAADSYKPTRVFEGNVTLIKTENNALVTEQDYGLSKWCKKTVLIHTIDDTHRGIVQGESAKHLAEIISSKL